MAPSHQGMRGTQFPLQCQDVIREPVSQTLRGIDCINDAPHRVVNGSQTNIMHLHNIRGRLASKVPYSDAQSSLCIHKITTLILLLTVASF